MGTIKLLAVLSLAASASMYGQEVSASITGRVLDPSGSAIVGAKVIATNLDRGTEYPTETLEDGIYAFPRIPVGRYNLKVEAKGFKTNVVSDFTLEVNQRARFDVRMEVGGLTETVTVNAEAAALQTDTTQVGSVITSQTIVNTPLITRNPLALTLLAAGVTTPDPNSFNTGQRTSGGGRPYVNGNRKEGNNFLLDGVDNNQTSDNLTSYQPNLDAIAEFKMITNNASAEFGNFQGGIINVILKSGTNHFHGNVFEYFRNDKLNANNWGRNWTIGQNFRPPIRWNQFGGTVGGPIFKDKLFFFADYQGIRRATPPSISAARVMPLAWRKGDFSNLLDPVYSGVAGGIQLYNPSSVNSTTGARAPFPNNQIPTAMFSPVIQKLFADQSIYPAPSLSTQVLATDTNYFYTSSSYLKSDQGDFKLDYRPSDKDELSARYSNGRQDTPGVSTAPFLYNSFNIAPFQNGVVNWTRTITPRLVNEARVGVNNIMLNNGGEDKGLGDIATKLGIQNAGAGLFSLQGFAYATSLGNANIGTQQLFANTTYHYADNLTLIRGRHMMKTGFNILRQQINSFYAGNNGRSGYMNFSGRFTAANAINPAGKQVGEADFVLGLPSDLGRGVSTGTWGHRKTIYGFYFQDDWRATDRLTLNLGLRWEYHTPLVEVKDRQSNFGMFSGALEIAGQNGNSRALYNAFKKDFQPRVGFAYSATRKIVVRGAYTISSFMEGTGTNLRLPLNPPFNAELTVLYNTPTDLLPATTIVDGFPANTADPFNKATIRLWDPFVRPANVQQWNFTTEFQLPGQNVLTLGYVGQHGTHLVVAMPYFQKQIVNGQILPSPYLSGNPTLTSKISQISGTCSCANQKYNSLQATLRKRFSMGLEYNLAYTWQKGLSDSIGYYGDGGQSGSQSAYWQNLYDRRSEWSPTYFNVKQNFVGSFVYETPFGKGKKYGANWNPVVNGVLGGWQLGGIYTAHGGFPLTIKMSGDPSGTGARSFRANVIGTPNDPHQIGPGVLFLDPTPYAAPTARTFGNAGPGIVDGPGMSRFDLSLAKKFYFSGEKRWLEIRAETFNLTNSPIFLSPASQTITSSLFGQIRSSQGERNVELAAKLYF